jgi:hypothetical protein
MSLLQRQICQDKTLLHSAAFFPVPLIRMVYEANPAAISHQCQMQGCLYINVLRNTIDTVRYLYSLYPEAAKLKDPGNGDNSAPCSEAAV